MSSNKKGNDDKNKNMESVKSEGTLSRAGNKAAEAGKTAGNVVVRTAKSPLTWAFISGLATGAASAVGWTYFNGK